MATNKDFKVKNGAIIGTALTWNNGTARLDAYNLGGSFNGANAVDSTGPLAFTRNGGTLSMGIDSSGNVVVNTGTFTAPQVLATGSLGGTYVNQGGGTSTLASVSSVLQNPTPYTGSTTAATGNYGLVAAPMIIGAPSGTFNTIAQGFIAAPSITSSVSTSAVGLLGANFIAYRQNAADVSAAGSTLRGAIGQAGHNAGLTSVATSTLAYGVYGAATNLAGTIGELTAVQSVLSFGSPGSTTGATTTTAHGFNSTMTLGGGTGTYTLTNLYGLRLQTPTIGAGVTITNRFGVSSEDASATNYFAGSVGIGTTVAVAKLDVRSGSASLNMANFTDGTFQSLVLSSTGVAGSTGGIRYDTANGGYHVWSVSGGTELMRLSASGNLGVGSAPSFNLDVQKTQNAATVARVYNGTTGSSGTAVVVCQSDIATLNLFANSSGNVTGGVSALSGIQVTTNTPFGIWTNNVERIRFASTGDVTVAGAFYATTKSFLIQHPSKPGMKLRYGSLESPYHGVRLTGQASMLNGYCRVTLPDYIRDLVKDDGSQVQLTNIQHGKVLWVQEINIAEGTFDVMCETTDRELKFFWSFTAVRKDVPDMIVEE
jgi:hypothetical protein